MLGVAGKAGLEASRAALRRTAKLGPRALVVRLRDALPEGRAISEDVWRRRHRGLVTLLWLHVGAIFAFSMAVGEGLAHSILEAGIVATAAGAAAWGPDGRRFRSIAATLGLVSSSAILVHLSGGYIELHFHYFFTLAAVSLYHDWAPFLTAIGFVAVQHGAMGALDPHSVYNHPDGLAHPWRWALIHAAFVLAVSAVSLVRWKSSEVEALKDPLTWLPNRALFGDRLRQAIVRLEESGSNVAVLFLDIDDFKAINDTAGHGAGDRLLMVVADRLREVLRPFDTVARLGGDEFAIVLEDVADSSAATAVAERILDALSAPLRVEDRQLSISASIGIAVRSDGDSGDAELVRNADIAMYVAKKGGKGRYALFEPSMHRDVMERSELAKDLEGALERGELHLHYQPVTTLGRNEVAGFEALLRWNHPRLGQLPPLRFIPLAEETGLIVPIGRWVLEEACRQACEWDAEFPSADRWMSVNLSPQQVGHTGIVEDVSAALRRTGFPAERLLLEITETAMIGDTPETMRRLHALKSLGVRLALDDFGTGYSSLGYLRRLPIDILKIDKTFVDGADRGAEQAALARAILKIAESIGIRCVAEGVEREEQATALRIAGCELAQGFYFSKPVEPERIGELLRWRPATVQPRGTVLIVDDDDDIRRLVDVRLRDAGFSTIEAGTGAEAIEVLRSRQVDLVVLDAYLPDTHGLDVGSGIKSDPNLRSIPILILSGSLGAHQDHMPMLRGRADAFMRKPFRGDELVSNVRTLLRMRQSEELTA